MYNRQTYKLTKLLHSAFYPLWDGKMSTIDSRVYFDESKR